MNLVGQQFEEFLDVYSDVVVDGLAVDGGISEIPREEDGAGQLYDALQRFPRRERFTFLVLVEQSLIGLAV